MQHLTKVQRMWCGWAEMVLHLANENLLPCISNLIFVFSSNTLRIFSAGAQSHIGFHSINSSELVLGDMKGMSCAIGLLMTRKFIVMCLQLCLTHRKWP
jgi:hypothetical protein